MNSIVYVGRHLITFTTKQHYHDDWELVYCTGGHGQFEFQNLTLSYGAGDLVVIPPKVPHTNISNEGFTNIHMNIIDATFPFREPLILSDDSDGHILNAFRDAFYFFNSEIDGKQLIVDAFGNLVVNYVVAFRDKKPLRSIVDEIKSDIMQNFTDCDYELDKYLHSIPFSYDYLRKLFKSEMGMTPHNYLTNLRVQMAEKLLCSYGSDELNISEIAVFFESIQKEFRLFAKKIRCNARRKKPVTPFTERGRFKWHSTSSTRQGAVSTARIRSAARAAL